MTCIWVDIGHLWTPKHPLEKTMTRSGDGMEIEIVDQVITLIAIFLHLDVRSVVTSCSGHNSATLHYGHAGEPNAKTIKDGDMW